MARALNRLNARKVQTIAPMAKMRRYGDGGGLYLIVDPSGSRRWLVLYQWGKKRREMGLGSLNAVSLAKAREIAAEVRAKVAAGIDPLEERRKAEAPPEIVTFGIVADRFMDKQDFSEGNRDAWTQTLRDHAASIRGMPIADVDTKAVLSVIEPIWRTKHETAKRVRSRIWRILEAARVQDLRSGQNPAQWTGHLDNLLGKPRGQDARHHIALPYADLPAFMVRLRASDEPPALALEMVVLTAARSGEVRGMIWSEVDLQKATWTVPASRMKAGRPHTVPLSARAIEILTSRTKGRPNDLIFPNSIGTMAADAYFSKMLRRLGYRGPDRYLTVHGFRSAFRDWAAEQTEFPREIIETALAHQAGTAVELAYRRTDFLEKRRALMDHWAAFTMGSAST